LQKFSPKLLQIFDYAVNYHNGTLPDYRGLMATCWSVYHQDSATGFTFHRINEKMDEGNTLVQAMVPVKCDSGIPDLEFEKAVQASRSIPGLLKIIMKREPGQVQTGHGNYFSKKDSEKITFIDNPSKYSHAELVNRLRAFDALLMNIKGAWYDVTRLDILPAPPKSGKAIYFKTSDGIIMSPSRFWFLPFSMYRILKKTGWPMPSRTESSDAQ
jgi:methionyl-tRNA formyltransferase